MKYDFDRSTAAGQRRMFWDSHHVQAENNRVVMADMHYDLGHKDCLSGLLPRYPNIGDYMKGYNNAKASLPSS